MSIVNTTQILDAIAPFMVRGRLVHVDFSGTFADDTAGDGSKTDPYYTIGRGVQDLRTDKNDILIIDNAGVSSAISPIRWQQADFVDLRNFMVLGIGMPYLGSPFVGTKGADITSWAYTGSNTVEVTVAGGHGMSAGHYCQIGGAAATGDAHPNGLWKFNSDLGGGTVKLDRVIGNTVAGSSGTNQPFSGGAQGYFCLCAMSFQRCENFLVAGMGFSSPSPTGKYWTSVAIDGTLATNQSQGRNGKFYGCHFGNATLHLARAGGTGIAFDLTGSGTNFRVEKCVFTNDIWAANANQAAIAYSALNDFVVSESLFYVTQSGGGSSNWTQIIRRGGTDDQKYGALFTANLIDTSYIPLGTIYGTQREGLDAEPVNNVLHRNYYTGATPPEAEIISSGGKQDLAPSSFINQDNVPSHWDLMWGSSDQDKTTANTMGKLVVDLDVTVSSILSAVSALNDLGTADITASVWGITEAALAAAGATGLMLAIGLSRNTQIDFTGDDALGWQLIVNNTAGSEIARADLYDEADARIPSSMSVAAFISAQKSISRVVPS